MNRLDGRAAIVTGAASGIGLRIARAFAIEGANVLIVDVRDDVEGTARSIGANLLGLRCDVGECADIERAVSFCVERFGRVDCVVNNAAAMDHFMLDEMRDEIWGRVLDVNVRALAQFAREAKRHLAEQAGSSIINIASVRANVAMPGGIAYDTSKAAVLGLTRTLAVELGPLGVRVNAICPGHIMSNGEEAWKQGLTEEARNLMRAPYPLGRVGRPEEIASVAVFLASDDASFITGQAIYVDGGMTIMNPETAVFRAAETLGANQQK